MNKDKLIELGLTEEQAKAVIEGYGIMIPKSRLDDKIAELNAANETIKERDKQLTDLGEKAKGHEELQKQITDLTEANQKAAEEYAATLAKKDYDHALSKALSGTKAKNVKALTALLDLDKVKLEGESLTGLDEQINALKESDAYLFEVEQKQEEEPPAPPKPRFSNGQKQGNNDPVDAFAAKLAKYKK
ncbi:putative minor structural protein [Bacillus phage vB_BceS_LY5]|uniref:putative minor structural protein n=1 Tax=Bacillus phage vB_BceS_LY5 TaxID=2996058 RepID=UPI004054F6C4|nr:putative minor structural protein [Bacillus phage vB_BceS_LY5]